MTHYSYGLIINLILVLKIGLTLRSTHQNVVTRPIPSSSASSSHTGRSVKPTRKIHAETSIFLHVPTSVTSFKHGFSGVL